MAYIQVGGSADGAADAAPSPSRFALGRRSQAHARTDKQTENRTKARRSRSRPAEPLGAGFRFFPPRMAFFYGFFPLLFCTVSGGVLCNFRQQLYYLGTYLSDIFAFYPASEAVEKKYLPIVLPVGTDDILVHDVRHEVLIQSARIDEFSAGFLYVFYEILHGLWHFGDMVNWTELIPPESLGKKRILLYRLHFLLAGIEVSQRFHFSGHGAFGDIEQPVEV